MEAEPTAAAEADPVVEVGQQTLQALRLLRQDGLAALVTVAMLAVPAVLMGGLSLSLLIAPLFPAFQAAQYAPLTLVQALKPLQVHSFFIYSGIFLAWLALYRAVLVPLLRAALLNRLMSLGVGERLSGSEPWLRLFPNLHELLQTLGHKWSRILGGLLLGVLPGLVWACFFALAELVCVLEGRAGLNALRRSRSWMEASGNLARYLKVQGVLWGLWLLLTWLLGQLWGLWLGPPEGFGRWCFQVSLPGLLLLPLETAQDFVFYADLQVRRRRFERLFQQLLVKEDPLEQVLVE